MVREYVFSDQGQINLANGYARPIRVDLIKSSQETLSKLLPSELYKAARPTDPKAWQQEVLTQM